MNQKITDREIKRPFVTEEEIWRDISNYVMPSRGKNHRGDHHFNTAFVRESLEDKNRADFVDRVNQAIVAKKQEVLV